MRLAPLIFFFVLIAASHVARAEGWTCMSPNATAVTGLKLRYTDPAPSKKITATVTLNPIATAFPTRGAGVSNDRAFWLESSPTAIERPLDGMTILQGRSDSLDRTQINLHVVVLFETEFGASAEVYTELGSGNGSYKDSLSCRVSRP